MDTAIHPASSEPSAGLSRLAYRPDGARLAVADTALRIEVREAGRPRWSRSLASGDPKASAVGRIRGLAYAPDGRTLYALGAQGLVALDGDTGEPLWGYEPPHALGFLVVSAIALAVRRDGLVAAAFDNGAIGAWSPEGDLCGLWRDLDGQRHLAFLGDGRLLGDDSFGLSVFDVEGRQRLYRTPLRERSYGLAAAPDGNVAVRTLHEAWQIAPSGEVFARTVMDPGLPTLAYHPFEPLIALGSAHAVVLVDRDGHVERRWEVPETTVISLAFALDGSLAIGGSDGGLRTVQTP